MKRNSKVLVFLCLFFWVLAGQGVVSVNAMEKKQKDDTISQEEVPDFIPELKEGLDYNEIQNAIDEIQMDAFAGEKFQFKEYVEGFISGKRPLDIKTVLGDLGKGFLLQLRKEKGSIVQLIVIAVIAAVFTSFTNVFKDSQVAEAGFYVTYLLLFTLLTTTFYKIAQVAGTTLDNLKDFMMALLPTYAVGVAFCTGSKTSMAFYETTLGIIAIVDVLLIHIILPMINVYFVLLLANNIMKEDMLSNMSELLEKIISWSLKTVLAAVIGINVIQNLVIPVTDQVKKSILLKTAQAIPGVGSTMRAATESILQASVLIKNSIGVAGLLVIVFICLVPISKLVIYQLIYSFGAAIVQPISDQRILNCINATAKSAKMLMSVVLVAAVLFLFTIVIVTSTQSLA